MRKIFKIGVSLILCIFMASCASISSQDKIITKEEVSATVTSEFEAVLNIKYKELQATATIKQDLPQKCSIMFTSPQSLKDMYFEMDKETVLIDYKGLKLESRIEDIPNSSVVKLVVFAIDQVAKKNGIRMKLQDTALIVSGALEGGVFDLVLDATNANILKLIIPEQQLEIEFINFKFI
ncbi:MAG: hypothetical protein RSB96_00230 [Oscillospiraceae bacterium]